MKNIIIALPVFLLLLTACGGSDKVEVGNKTTFEVNAVFDGGDVIKGEKVDAKFKVTNTGDYPLVIADVKGSCTCTVVDKPEEPIAPGDSYDIVASVDTDRTSFGAISKGVTIVANTTPSVTTVTIKANVIEK